MHKSSIIKLFLIGSLTMLLAITFASMNIFQKTNAMAQEYRGYNPYNEYPTSDNKYECHTGPFEGFFVSSVEFCEDRFDDKDRKIEIKKFTCPDSGIVVDEKAHCPQICPEGTQLSGHLVAAELNLRKVCNTDGAKFETCREGTDLEGVKVTNEPDDCDIFAECGAGTPLGQALGLMRGETVEVADVKLCKLTIPANPATNLQAQCIKCGDLAIAAAAGMEQRLETSAAIRIGGPFASNIFSVCNTADPKTAFSALVNAEPVL